MLTAFRNHLVARRRSPATIKVRMVYLRHLDDSCDLATAGISELELVLAIHPEWKPETVNAAISSWSVFYKWAIRAGVLTTNPAEDLERAPILKRVKTLADDQRVRDALRNATPHERAILLLGREAGLRRAEIASLHRSNRSSDWLTIIGKGERQRSIHLTPGLAAALDAIDTDGYYFPGKSGGHIPADTVYKTVVRLIGTTTHSLRRSAITAVYRGTGGDIRIAQEFAGHANPNTTAIYVPVLEGDLRRASGVAALLADPAPVDRSPHFNAA